MPRSAHIAAVVGATLAMAGPAVAQPPHRVVGKVKSSSAGLGPRDDIGVVSRVRVGLPGRYTPCRVVVCVGGRPHESGIRLFPR